MYILDVVPLTPLPRNQPQIMSYYHSGLINQGTFVQVFFNNRKIRAVVVSSDNIKKRKVALKKQATFTLKPIIKVLPDPAISVDTLNKTKDLSAYYFSPLGLTLKAVVAHPDAKNYKKYISPGTSRIEEALDEYIPEISEFKIQSSIITIVDMRKEIRNANYSIFSREIKEALQVANEENEKFVIFIPHKGYANFLLCKSCGQAIKCKNCSASLVVYLEVRPLSSELRGLTSKLICHHCGFSESQPKQCSNCQSYALKPYGIGIDRVEAELIKFFHYQNLSLPTIVKITSESKKLPADWDILIATQSLFRYYSQHKMTFPTVRFLGIVNADTLIHIPDFRAEEKLLRQTLLLASMAKKTFIQTYNPDDPALVAAATNRVDDFWKKELEHRKQFSYPPFVKLVKLASRNRNGEIIRHNAIGLAKLLGGMAYPALFERERGMYVWNILLKFSLNNIRKRNEILRQVPPDWSIDVDPISTI